jgi:hypothetical protein
MAKTICKILGIAFILVGLVGFISHDFLGTHLSFMHNLVHIISGIVALYFGFAGSLRGARLFCLVFGAVYLLLGLVGFLGPGGAHSMPDMAGANDSNLLKVIPGNLELGIMDHIVHILLGIVFLIGGLMTKADVARVTD